MKIEKKITSFDRTQLYTTYYGTEKPIGTILWIHGFAEHSGRYKDTISFFLKHNYNSLIFDLRGHGKSGGTRAYVENFNHYLKDIDAVYDDYKNEITEPIYLLGHSMGGLITIRYLQQQDFIIPVKKAILSAPALGLKIKVPAWKEILSKIVVNIYPKIAIPTGMSGKDMTHDNKIAQEYDNDPMVLKKATAGWFEEFKKNMILANANAHKINTPTHIFMGDADPVIDPEVVKNFYNKLPKNIEKSIHFFKGFYHECFSEVGKEEVRKYVLTLLK